MNYIINIIGLFLLAEIIVVLLAKAFDWDEETYWPFNIINIGVQGMCYFWQWASKCWETRLWDIYKMCNPDILTKLAAINFGKIALIILGILLIIGFKVWLWNTFLEKKEEPMHKKKQK